jgi:hypothetical protein
MAYAIHIKRRTADAPHSPISLSEWRAAVSRVDGVRMADGDYHITNPKIDERITLRNAGGDAEVFFPDDGAWLRAFRWSPEGRISFRAPRDFLSPTCFIRRLAAELARELDAQLIGDEGEIYD